MSTHAKLPASAAHRWTACPASAYLKDNRDDRRGSKFAAEGTAAHLFVEHCILEDVEPKTLAGVAILVGTDGDAFFDWDSPSRGDDDWEFLIDAEMVSAAEVFLQCRSDALMLMDSNGVELIEERVSPGHDSLGGTLDWAYVAGNRAAIADLKYGRGVVVEVTDNPQQMIYALGLLAEYPDVEFVDSYIVQPRAPHADGSIRVCSYTRAELLEFYQYLLGCINDADSENPTLKSGDHCRFCPALATCPEVFSQAQKAAAIEFADGPQERIAEGLKLVSLVEAWVKAIRSEALTRLMDDQTISGWKLVHGRSTRQWTVNEQEVVKLGRTLHILKSLCYSVPKLLSPAGMEKAAAAKGTAKPVARAHFNDSWESPPGKPTLAPESDPRPPFRHAPEEDFEVV